MARKLKIKDDNGNKINDGDIIHFSYGLPPLGVDAKVRWDPVKNDWIVLTPGHNPTSCKLRYIKKWMSPIYKVER